MSEKSVRKAAPPAVLTVGARLLVRRQSEATTTGEIVEDYAELTDSAERGHHWAPVHRWAVALDDGRLVFADTEDLTADPGTR
ncbi:MULTISPECIES: hypothetical protein [Rhodococcus]|uniref:Uncharacterized protein n=1 Tax=Rhodococcus opacus (strain B4) TaxID=632772 RepID=C1BCA3_RHOOB|nr:MULTISPECIES: hypothetical protein [Rhodococcus]KAF0966664.1 hypothetical protein MLGJGCBP_00152 [Rhodococcus sp. T7]QQZ18331.1 hypothetical protein GO592_39670 [Rhodococcus sp. 21391]UOT08268.1 hypothetical protein MPY17_38790 [Rhodococcus opacus]BAH55958.1 hypothetical protein ROP_pROB01-04590 [Rhodococcus opacus B4]